MQREHIPPLACIPNNWPEVVLTVMDCDQTWITKMERTTIDIVMRHTMKEEEAGIRWGGFKTSVRPGLIEVDSALRSHQASQSQSAHWPGNNTVLMYFRTTLGHVKEPSLRGFWVHTTHGFPSFATLVPSAQ